MVKFDDLRQWIEQAAEIDELVVGEGADLNLEIGTVAQLSAKNQGPAVLHRKIKGYPPNFRILTNMLCNVRTFNLAFGLPLDATMIDTIEIFRKKALDWERESGKFPPEFVDNAPILENVVEGDDIDLNIFPVPRWHELDGGFYIGTADNVITRDYETGQINAGTYRCQLHDRYTVGMMITHGHHGRVHRDAYFDKGKPCPAVMVFGVDPLLFAVGASEIPQHVCEFNYVGAVRNRPVPVIKGRVTGLPIPANAEIAIEGFVDPKARKAEGQFGEWQGYYAGSVTEQPFLRASTLYYRNDPILTGSPPAKGIWNDHAFLRSIWRSAILHNELLAANISGIKAVWCPPAGGSRNIQIISIKQQYGGHATQVGHAAVGVRSGAFAGRYTIIVDDDVDPYDFEDVAWALATRSLPTECDIIKKSWGSHSEPLFFREIADTTDSTPPRAIVYAVKPYERRNQFSPVNLASEDLRREVFAKWQNVFKGRCQTI